MITNNSIVLKNTFILYLEYVFEKKKNIKLFQNMLIGIYKKKNIWVLKKVFWKVLEFINITE